MTPPPAPASLRRADGAAPRVLVVDDEQMLTDLLSMALRMEGWDVRTAASGFQALQSAREFAPDAMVLDIMMPDLDGMAVLQRLRQSGDNVPVRLVTYLIAALEYFGVDVGDGAFESLRSSQTDPCDALLVDLINALSAYPDKATLVLDGFHVITEQRTMNLLAFLTA